MGTDNKVIRMTILYGSATKDPLSEHAKLVVSVHTDDILIAGHKAMELGKKQQDALPEMFVGDIMVRQGDVDFFQTEYYKFSTVVVDEEFHVLKRDDFELKADNVELATERANVIAAEFASTVDNAGGFFLI